MAIKRTPADSWFSKCVRIRNNWICEYCNVSYEHDRSYVHCSHYVSRSNRSTRYHPDNAFCHCVRCHEILGGGRWGGGNHAEFAYHYDEVFGSEKREFIRRLSKYPFPYHNKHIKPIASYYRQIYQEIEEMRNDGEDCRIEFECYDGSSELNALSMTLI